MMVSTERNVPPYGRLLPWAVAGLLLVTIAVIYGRAIGFGFLAYDDPAFVFDNSAVRGGLTGHGIVWAFTDGPFGEWYPLAMLSHMVDCTLFGLNPHWHHLISVLLHAATAVGLFLVWWRMTGEPWPSALVAMLFAVHPQRVESVVWIAERRDVLSGLFFVLTLGAYLEYVRLGRSWGRYFLVALLLALGLLAKAILVTLPAVLLLLDYWPLGRFGRALDLPSGAAASTPRQSLWSLVLEKLPLLAIAMSVAVITMLTHSAGPHSAWSPWSVRLAGALTSLVTYLMQFFYPLNLAICYPYPAAGYPVWQWVGSAAILAAITAVAILWRQRRPYLLVGWLWFVGMLLPVSGVVQVSHDAAMADRYTYLPTIGLSVALAWGASRLAARLTVPRWGLAAGGGLLVAVLTAASVRQTSFWNDDETLWSHSLATTEDNCEAETALADALRRAKRLDEALVHFRLALGFGANAKLLNNMGVALLDLGQLDEAGEKFRAVIKLDPNGALAHDNLGRVLLRRDELDDAAEEFHLAIKRDRSYAPAWFHLGQVLAKEKQIDGAIDDLERATELDPTMAAGHRLVAALLASQGRAERAIAHYRAALRLSPDDAEARAGLEKLGAR